MSSDPPPTKSRGVIGNYFRRVSEKSKNLLKSPRGSSPQHLPGNLTLGSNSASPTPSLEPSVEVTGNASAQRSTPVQKPSASAPDPFQNLASSSPACVDTSDDPAAQGSFTLKHVHDTGGKSYGRSWMKLESALRALHQTVHIFPPLQSAIGTMISCLELVSAAAKSRQDYDALASDLEGLIVILEKHFRESNSLSMSDCVANVVESINVEAGYINKKREQGIASGIMQVGEDADELVHCYRRIEALFRRLQVDASLSTWSIVHEHLANTRLEATSPAKLASYDSALPANIVRRTCTENTRTEILSGLNFWSHDPATAKVYWMNGMAGTGKTTIACSLSEMLAKHKRLGASFFCTRTLPECRDVRRIIPTLAYQLARYSRPFQSALCRLLENDPDIGTRRIPQQFERLLKEPLLEVKEAMPENVVVVIDALDECDDSEGVRVMLETLFKDAALLPLKFFVASRPEPEIVDQMRSQGGDMRSILHLHEIEQSLVKADIELYLREELAFMLPSDEQVKQLAQLAGTLFIYAATAVRYIRPSKTNRAVSPQGRLGVVLTAQSGSTKQHTELDGLYITILQAALNSDALEVEEVGRVQLVLWTAVCVREPVSVETLATLAGLEETDTEAILQSLRSVLHISEASNLVSTLHTSFADFILTPSRSGGFFCDETGHSSLLAQRCFEIMKEELKFNICKLESSFVPDNMIKDLAERIDKYISQSLVYACRHWDDHLSLAAQSDKLCIMLNDFLSSQLLFWMEVMNLSKAGNFGVFTLKKVQSWLQDGHVPADFARFISDANDFVTLFSSNPVSLATPHIYISLLAFCHKSSKVFTQYHRQVRGLMGVRGTATEHRGSAALAIWDAGGPLRSISISPDGTLVAFGGARSSKRGIIGVINQHSGVVVVRPFEGHARRVNSVAFSPDGTRICSGSNDNTICVWSAYDGHLVAGPFKGHTDWVNTVAFSPDGRAIASGSDGASILFWDAQDGKHVASPFNGHTSRVRSVAFSPDGACIVSGSDDRSICIWSVRDCALVVDPLKGHTNAVTSVAFSPSSSLIVSGSEDKTVCVWDSRSGTRIAGPFIGHTGSIRSVAFSPDGARIISGSTDKSIRMWSAQDGELIAGPFKGHADWVRSVAFSPDGLHIVSGSDDKTICMWNARNSRPATGQFKGLMRSVRSVAFSPDSTRIVSGSSDSTICVWSVLDGSLIVGPFRGHKGSVRSVAFSPDGLSIVSGSSDETVCVWNAQDGYLIAGPFKQHTDRVASVGFSSDGMRIVSGSSDKTICIQNARDGMLVAPLLKGHTGYVLSVSFSPDGTHIVSGSSDETICVWNSQDGTPITGPFRAHNDWVNSVAFSPDGTLIVSSSSDKTICVWNAKEGTRVAGPFKGHTGRVMTAVFSPDGMRIVSGSNDRTVRVWSVNNGTLVAGPFKGHTDWVSSVAFSPDGTHIASSSDDCSIRLIDTNGIVSSIPGLAGEWDVKPSGWVMSHTGHYLFWVPQHLRSSLPRLYHSCVIGPEGALQVEYSKILVGKSWSQCYVKR